MNGRIALLLLIILPVFFACTEKEQEIRVESVTLSKSSTELTIGETLQLSASVFPASATNKEISWSSSNQSVASVSSSGLVTAAGEGTATITATADGKKAECAVSVKKAIAVSEVKLDKTELTLFEGKEETLTATVLPKDATDQTVTWSSSDPSVATVVSGKVTALKAGSTTITASVENIKAECIMTVNMQYGKVAITDLKPDEILPVIGQVEVGDKRIYEHIEHLRVAEATRIRDMMWEYGAGEYSVEEYQRLMGRLNVMMVAERPLDYDNYEVIGDIIKSPSEHAYSEWSILNFLIDHANFKVIEYSFPLFKEYFNNNPDSFNILACSIGASYKVPGPNAGYREVDQAAYAEEGWFLDKNAIQFTACSNQRDDDEGYHSNICQIDMDLPDEESSYQRQASNANGKNDPVADRYHIITIGSNENGLTYYDGGSVDPKSCFPLGFHDDVLFSGRAFPCYGHSSEGERIIEGEWGYTGYGYQCSYTNYFNAAMASICFQMKADTKDADELLDMLRSTSLKDRAIKNRIVQPLHLINLAGIIRKYLMPLNIPVAVNIDSVVDLGKGYYKGVLFSIPGAEVKINGEWIAFDNKNKDTILGQNPMTLEWRLNGDLLKKYGYTSGQTVEGQIITVDDKWGGLRLEVPMSITIL